MKSRLLSTAITLSMLFQFAPSSASAQDASWGCQVLLCAASKNPSWHGVPYCVPPMVKLIRAMSLPGFSWPVCQGSGTGKPGFEIYDACPEGTKIAYSQNGDRQSRNEADRCEKTVDICDRKRSGRRDGLSNTLHWSRVSSDTGGCRQIVSIPRPRRADPYFFDIGNNKDIKQRFWFNLNN